MRHRLFVALPIPAPVADVLLGLMGGVAGARWQTREQLHLTLRFIGEVDRHAANDIAAALGRVNITPFTARLDAPGHFTRNGRIDQLWVGVQPRALLADLAQRVDAALRLAGVAPETRAFVPHVTLARFGRHGGQMGQWPGCAVPGTSWQVADFALYESHITHAGAHYEPLARYGAAAQSSFQAS